MTAIRHVLLVEDDANDARLTTRYLERWHQPVTVHIVSTIAEAREFLANREETTREISLILLDHMLPGGSGIELLAEMRANQALKTVPIVMLTGNSDGVIVQRAREAGANSCVLKPVDPSDYERTVTSITEFWLGTNLVVRPDDRATLL